MSNKTINIHGFEFTVGDEVYQVTSKWDADAPKGYRDQRTTKLISPASGKNTCTISFNDKVGVWDTGLYADSPMYNGLSKEKRLEIEKIVNENIVKPYEEKFGKGKLDPRDPESRFWNRVDESSFKIELYKDRIFNTAQPEERLEMFLALASRNLCPKDQESSPDFRRAQFCIENKEKVRNLQQENDFLDVEATGAFYGLLDKPKELKLILNYVGVKTSGGNKLDKQLETSKFKRFADHKKDGYTNKKMFLEAVSMSKTAKGYEELNYYKIAQDLYRKGVITKNKEYFYLGDDTLGTNLKEVAATIAKDKAIQIEVMNSQKSSKK